MCSPLQRLALENPMSGWKLAFTQENGSPRLSPLSSSESWWRIMKNTQIIWTNSTGISFRRQIQMDMPIVTRKTECGERQDQKPARFLDAKALTQTETGATISEN